MILRSSDEIKAYIEGYNACYHQYNEFLKKRPVYKAQMKMKLMMEAVNNAMVFTEGNENENREKS